MATEVRDGSQRAGWTSGRALEDDGTGVDPWDVSSTLIPELASVFLCHSAISVC